MLKKRLRSLDELVRSRAAVDRSSAAGLRSRTYGRAARTNGRIFVRTIGSASLTNGSTWWLATLISRNAGRSDSSDGPSTFANEFTLTSVCLVCSSAPGRRLTPREICWFAAAKDRNTALDD